MISYVFCDIIYDFDNIISLLACLALFSSYVIYDIIHISYQISFDISMLWYHNILISECCYIIAFWYHGFHDIFPYIMAPARRDGAVWGPNLGAPAATGRRFTSSESGLAITNLNVLGSQWRLLFIWTATAWIPRMDLLQSLLPSFKFKVKFFKLDVNSSSNLWAAAHHRHIYSHLAQVGHLVVAGLPHCAQDRVTDSHTGRPWSPPGRLGFTVSLAQPDSRCDWQMAVVYKCSETELVHVTARALIIEIQLHRAPLQRT